MRDRSRLEDEFRQLDISEYQTPEDRVQSSCRSKWLNSVAPLPQAVKDALDSLNFPKAIDAAVQRGFRDPDALTKLLFYTKYGGVHGYCPIKKGTRIPGGDRYDDVWAHLRKTFVTPKVGVPTPVLDLETVEISYQPRTRLRYRLEGTFEGWFTKPLHRSGEPQALRNVKVTGRVRIADAIGRRNYDSVRDSALWPLRRAEIRALPFIKSANGPVTASASVVQVKDDGTFVTSTQVAFDGLVQKFSMSVKLVASASLSLHTSVELAFVQLDVARYIATIDPHEQRRPRAQTHLEFLASVRKVHQGGSKDNLRGRFDLVLYRLRHVKELFAPDTPEARWLKSNEELYADGELVDIGHVLTGIEGSAKQRPGTEPNGDPQNVPAPRRQDLIVTWAGDLGSVFQYHIREIVAAIAQGKRPDMPALLEKRAKRADLIGDIDGINIGTVYDPNRSLAENFDAYYGRKTVRRFHEFVVNSLDDGGKQAFPVLPDTVPPRLAARAREWAAIAACNYMMYHFMSGLDAKVDPAHRHLVYAAFQPGSPQMRAVADYFIRFLEDGLAREV